MKFVTDNFSTRISFSFLLFLKEALRKRALGTIEKKKKKFNRLYYRTKGGGEERDDSDINFGECKLKGEAKKEGDLCGVTYKRRCSGVIVA